MGHRSGVEYLDLHPEHARCRVRTAELERRLSMELGGEVTITGGLYRGGDRSPLLRGRPSKASLRRIERLGIPMPVDLVVPDSTGLHANHHFVPHGFRPELTLDCFISMAGVFTCVPELLYVQMARGLGRIALIEQGLQIAGTYRRVRPEAVPMYRQIPGVKVEVFPENADWDACISATAYKLPRLVGVDEIASFADAFPTMCGIAKIRRILPYLCEGIASPLEAEWYLRSCLPKMLGGLSIARPLVNQRLDLSPRAARLAGKHYIVSDFRWPDKNVALEINGFGSHGDRDGVTETSRRSKAYAAMGIRSFTLTADELHDKRVFLDFSAELCELLGEPLTITPSLEKRMDALRRDILELDGATSTAASRFQGLDDPGYFEELSRYIDMYGA